MAAPVIHFEIQATDRPRLAAFYETVFGWKTQSASGMPYTLLMPTGAGEPGQGQSEGIGGGMLDRNGPAPRDGEGVNAFVCILQVGDLEATRAAVLQGGGRIVVEPFEVEGVGRVFYFRDPDGNLAGCLQPPG